MACTSLLRWLQVATVITNLFIALLGLAVVAVGASNLTNEKQYFTITDNRTELYRIPYSLILIGICVVCLAVLGIFGAVITKMIGGRILLGVYTFVLTLIIFSEVAAGGSALRATREFENTFVSSSLESLKNYMNTSIVWDKFQEKHECCGAENYTSYIKYGFIVPESCCVQPKTVDCNETRYNPNETLIHNFFSKGCPEAVLHNLISDFTTVGVVMMVFGVAQFVGVVMACFLAAVGSRDEMRQVSPYQYRRLTEQT